VKTFLRICARCLAVLAAAVAVAAPYPDFTGTWALDLDASRGKDLDEIMKRQGMNYFERLIARSTPVKNIIRQESNALLRIEVQSQLENRMEIQYLDDREQVSTNRHGQAVISKTMWSTNSDAVITRTMLAPGSGAVLDLSATRTLANDGKMMRLHIEVIDPGQRVLEADRIFQRESSP
jgi:hypothetical protein